MLNHASAASLGLNFTEFSGSEPGNFWPGEIVGPGENTNALDAALGLINTSWTNVNQSTGTITLGSDISVSWNAPGTWHAGSEALDGEDASEQVFRGYLDDNTVAGPVIEISGLSSYLASQNATSFTLTVLWSTDGTGFTTGHLGDGITTMDFFATIGGDGTWPNGLGGVAEGVRGYSILSGLTGDTYTIMTDHANGTLRGSLAGIVITAVPEPATVSLLTTAFIGAFALYRRRSR